MSNESWNLKGKLKPNAYKRNDRDPDYKGVCTIADETYFMSAWNNADGSIGVKFQTPENAERWKRASQTERDDGGRREVPAPSLPMVMGSKKKWDKGKGEFVPADAPQQQSLGGEFADDDIPF